VGASGPKESNTINAVPRLRPQAPVSTPISSRQESKSQKPPASNIVSIENTVVVPTTAAAATAMTSSTLAHSTLRARGGVSTEKSGAIQHPAANLETVQTVLVAGLHSLKIETKAPSLVVNGSCSTTTERSSKVGNSQTPSDDNSQRADSNSELGTKPPSLDGKSITSGTTFALDEKESLRPDDSASVKAAAEDDDSFSIRGSVFTSSRMGSEVAARIHRIQIGDMPPRTLTTMATVQSQEIATPQSAISEKQPDADAKLPLATPTPATDALSTNGFYSQNPDEKLLEAMQSQKDRIFLLKIEQQVINFVQDSK
jgi:hypothetical protein